MIKLRVVGSSEDHDELLLSNKPRGSRATHVVKIDQRMLDTLQEAVYARRDAARAERLAPYAAPLPSAPASKIPPREIQRMLRAGASTTQVAKAADVDAAYVEQFLVPVLYEREGIVRDAQTLFQEKPRLGASGAPLGEAVALNLASRHVRLDEDQLAAAWSATRQNGGPWTLTLTFPFRGRSRTARWKFDQRARTLVPVNELARDVGWVAPGSRRPAEPATVRVVDGGRIETVSAPVQRARGRGTKAAAAAASKRSTRKSGGAKKTTRSKSSRGKATRKPARAKKKATRATPSRARKTTARGRKPARGRTPARKVAGRPKSTRARKPASRTTRKPASRTTRKPASRAKKPAARKPARRRAATGRRARRR